TASWTRHSRPQIEVESTYRLGQKQVRELMQRPARLTFGPVSWPNFLISSSSIVFKYFLYAFWIDPGQELAFASRRLSQHESSHGKRDCKHAKRRVDGSV